MKQIFLLLAGILFTSTLHAQDIFTRNNITSKDSATNNNFMQRFFVTIGSGFNCTFNKDYGSSTTFISYVPSSVSIGASLSKRFSFNIELDYNRTDDIVFWGMPYIDDGNYASQTTSGYQNTSQITLIPNIIITANRHKFTPYGRIGILLGVYNSATYSLHSIGYNNSNFQGTAIGFQNINGTNVNTNHNGTFAAMGCNWKLSKTLSLYAEAFFKGATIPLLFPGDGNAYPNATLTSIGINLGLKVTL